jgi:peptide/nickel transport system permease protein
MARVEATSGRYIAQLQGEEEQLVSRSFLQKAVARLLRDRLTMSAITVILLFTVIAILAPVITDNILEVDPNRTDPMNNFLPIGSPGHLMGTDDIGRDQLARLLHAGGVSLGIGFFGAMFSLVIGVTLGTISGYFGGWVADITSWVVTTVDSIPSLYLLILFSAIFSPNATTLIFVFALVGWTGTLRLIRGQTFTLREQEYVLAARALGARPWRIMFAHIMPNLVSIGVVSLAFGIAGLILAESALSFLGLGVQPPQATWGNMLSKSQQYFRHGGHLVIAPGVLIFITVLCFYVIGDGVRDAFDPTATD